MYRGGGGLRPPFREVVLGGEEPVPLQSGTPVLYALILLNIAVYVVTSAGTGFIQSTVDWIARLGFIPAQLLTEPNSFYRIFTAMFTHADLMHIFFNMYFLYIFGRAVERALGSARFLFLYLLSGIGAALFHTVFTYIQSPASLAVPSIGASGAISGVLGAYMLMFPGTRLTTCFFLLFMPVCFEMLAAYYLLFWFAIQVFEGYFALNSSVAFFAHAGGFLTGIALLPLAADETRLRYIRILSRGMTLFGFMRFLPWMRQGLSPAAKTMFALLAATLLTGTVLSYIYAANNPALAAEYSITWVINPPGVQGRDKAFAMIDLRSGQGFVLASASSSLPGRITAQILEEIGVSGGEAAHKPIRIRVSIPYTLYQRVNAVVLLTDVETKYTSYDGVKLLAEARIRGVVQATRFAEASLAAETKLVSVAEAWRLLTYMALFTIAVSLAALYIAVYRDAEYVVTPEYY